MTPDPADAIELATAELGLAYAQERIDYLEGLYTQALAELSRLREGAETQWGWTVGHGEIQCGEGLAREICDGVPGFALVRRTVGPWEVAE